MLYKLQRAVTVEVHGWQIDQSKWFSNHFQSVQSNLIQFDHWPQEVNHLLHEILLGYYNNSLRCHSIV